MTGIAPETLQLLAYLSCRHCPEGRERAQGVANDNGGKR